MARNAIGSYWVGTGANDQLTPVPAVVDTEYDASGEPLADQSTDGDNVDIIVLGWANGKRSNVPIGTAKNQFER